MSKHTDIPLFDSADEDIGWRYYIQGLGDELAHIEDTLRTESFTFSIEHVIDRCSCPGKQCVHCGQVQCYGAFTSDSSRKDGLCPYCRTCRSDLRRVPKPVETHIVYPLQQHATSDCTCPGKRCIACQQVKCYGFFYKSTEAKSGLRGRCRACMWIADKIRRENDKAAYNAKRGEQRQRRLRGERGEISRQKQREHCRKYRQTHPEYFLEYYREYGKVRDEIRRAREKQATGSFAHREWKALKAEYDYTCLCCGRREPEIKLTADHVVPLAKGGSNSIDNIQPLCGFCNGSKGVQIIDYRRKHHE